MTALTDEAREKATRIYSTAYDIEFRDSGYKTGGHCIRAGVLAVAESMFAAGAAVMQERAAQVAETSSKGYSQHPHDKPDDAAKKRIASAIRALTTTTDEEG